MRTAVNKSGQIVPSIIQMGFHPGQEDSYSNEAILTAVEGRLLVDVQGLRKHHA